MKRAEISMNALLVSILVLLGACHETKLEQALQLAGDNRAELETVLKHYSKCKQDSLKLKAAHFLIENMPGHYTRKGEIMDRCRRMVTSSYFEKKTLDICTGVFLENIPEKEEDIKFIKAAFLIRHIDASFELLEKYHWTRELPFDVFLEYVLPYRLEYEEPDMWRDSLRLDTMPVRWLRRMDDKKYDISKLALRLQGNNSPPAPGAYQQLVGEDLNEDCHYMYLVEEFRKRAMGLPVVLDFFPYYANRNGYHYWCRVLSSIQKYAPVTGAPESKAAKVYRRTYARHFMAKPGPGEYVPAFFLDPFNKDVTEDYFQTANVTLLVRGRIPSYLRYGYLCVFNGLQWQPIAIGERKKEKVIFKNMGKDILYLPVFYNRAGMFPLDYPFALRQNGQMTRLIPDTMHRTTLRLYRKYPYTMRIDFADKFSSVVVEVSNDFSFIRKDTVAVLKLKADRYYIDENLGKVSGYRYWRIPSKLTALNIADLYFWDEKGNRLSVTTDSLNCFCLDNDPLTCAANKAPPLILDFGRAVSVSRIVCLPRSDGNGIYPGDEYELLYYDFQGWKSMGVRMATDFFLDFSEVPTGALYWLRNLSRGVEERVFTYENGEIRFW